MVSDFSAHGAFGLEALEYLRRHQDALTAEFAKATIAKHRGIRGTARERAVVATLEAVLPASVGLGRGEIVSYTGNRCPELDVVIFDGATGPGPFQLGGSTVFPVETVMAVISVRTRLDQRHLQEMAALAKELRDFDKFPRKMAVQVGGPTGSVPWPANADAPPGVFLLANTGLKVESVMGALAEIYKSDAGSDSQLNGIAVLNQGYVTTGVFRDGAPPQIVPFVRTQPGKHLVGLRTTRDALGLLTMALHYFLAYQPRIVPNVARYFDVASVAPQIDLIALER